METAEACLDVLAAFFGSGDAGRLASVRGLEAWSDWQAVCALIGWRQGESNFSQVTVADLMGVQSQTTRADRTPEPGAGATDGHGIPGGGGGCRRWRSDVSAQWACLLQSGEKSFTLLCRHA